MSNKPSNVRNSIVTVCCVLLIHGAAIACYIIATSRMASTDIMWPQLLWPATAGAAIAFVGSRQVRITLFLVSVISFAVFLALALTNVQLARPHLGYRAGIFELIREHPITFLLNFVVTSVGVWWIMALVEPVIRALLSKLDRLYRPRRPVRPLRSGLTGPHRG